ncbi:MAG: zeta toxin family protein [Bdellovibrionales bacterium]|nr:zeta toxin family protein [Bdellovibrionales bacterium]
MTKIKEIENYYALYEDTSRKKEYEQLLEKLSNTTNSREFFEKNLKKEVYSKRKKLHTDIINGYLDQYKSQKNPTFHFILGSIGSGKTSLKDTIFEHVPKKNFLYINFDEIKLKLPEYKILKKINPKKASYFVQSESAKVAGTLRDKAMKKRLNIVYEKNVRISKDGTLRLSGEMKEAFKKKYEVTIHVVFLDNVKEAWKRVEKRYEKTKRYVSKEDVKVTFQGLFPNLNRMINEVKGTYHIVLHYNSGSDIKNQCIGGISIAGGVSENMTSIKKPYDDFFLLYQSSRYWGIFFKDRVNALPPLVQSRLKQLSFFKSILR